MPFIPGESYTRDHIHEILGGEKVSYLPQKDGKIVCGCFSSDANPEAPYVILVGGGEDGEEHSVEMKAKILEAQNDPIPVFLKRASNDWVYEGNFRVQRVTRDRQFLEEKQRQAGRTDVVMALILESIESTTAYGLDLSGYTTGRSGFARANRKDTGQLEITVFSRHFFNKTVDGHRKLDEVTHTEVSLLVACIPKHRLVIDVPIDLQKLPSFPSPQYVWELNLRPVDYALEARPAFADRIGYIVTRFHNLINSFPNDISNALGNTLFETYPAAALRLMNLESEKYKGEATIGKSDEWYGERAIIKAGKKKGQENELLTKMNRQLADTLRTLEWRAPPGSTITHDEFDAAICAITGISKPEDLLEGKELEKHIESVIRDRYSALGVTDAANLVFRTEPPRGYRLLRTMPKDAWVQKKNALDQDLFGHSKD